MNKDLIKNEINGLEIIRLQWSRTTMTKYSALELVGKIGNFEHTFSVNFPYAEKYYKSDPFVKVNFNDGKEELEYYCNSNLKRKDNEYFKNGVEHINRAMNGIIKGLDNEINYTD
jgi:hypothetical protein